MLYLDASALVKLIVSEDESAALRAFLDGRTDLTSAGLARVEISRAARLRSSGVLERADRLIDRIDLIRVDHLLVVAASLVGARLRSLDAIHVAAAQTLDDELEALVTYDRQMQDAAQALGLPVAAPT